MAKDGDIHEVSKQIGYMIASMEALHRKIDDQANQNKVSHELSAKEISETKSKVQQIEKTILVFSAKAVAYGSCASILVAFIWQFALRYFKA